MENQCRQCRRFGTKLFLKGERCLSPKCSFVRRNYKPGTQGAKSRPPRKSEYGIQLIEKQKAKVEYGLRERQFSKTFKKAISAKANTGEALLTLLETRIDNVVYKLGWAASRKQARQLVLHRKIKLNDKIVNIPSIVLKLGDIVTQKDKLNSAPIKTVVPKWLKLDQKELKAEVLRLPNRDEIESDIDEQLIIEFYSR